MSPTAPQQLLRDQFSSLDQPSGGLRRPRWLQISLTLPGLLMGLGLLVGGVDSIAVPALLTATSILTGLTFTMALKFWERSIDARSDPFLATDGPRLTLLDNMRTHLVWTVLVGVASTMWLVVMALLGEVAPPSWFELAPYVGCAGAGALVIYQVTLVGGALVQFYEASYSLRR